MGLQNKLGMIKKGYETALVVMNNDLTSVSIL
jgi:N-acetylglucosamine-6-phosphate deacetylase